MVLKNEALFHLVFSFCNCLCLRCLCSLRVSGFSSALGFLHKCLTGTVFPNWIWFWRKVRNPRDSDALRLRLIKTLVITNYRRGVFVKCSYFSGRATETHLTDSIESLKVLDRRKVTAYLFISNICDVIELFQIK